MDGAQQLRYTMTSQDYVNGYAVAFETADFGRRMIRNFRIGAGSVFAGVAALAWFMVDDPVLARLLAGVYLVMGALFVVFGKPIAGTQRDTPAHALAVQERPVGAVILEPRTIVAARQRAVGP